MIAKGWWFVEHPRVQAWVFQLADAGGSRATGYEFWNLDNFWWSCTRTKSAYNTYHEVQLDITVKF